MDDLNFRIPARTIWSLRLTLGAAALMWFLILAVPLGVPTALLLFFASRTDGLLSTGMAVVGALTGVAYAAAILWWAATWGRSALTPWGGMGAFVGAFTSVLLIPALIWFASDVAYELGLWPVGAAFRIVAWLWLLAALVGVWRWIRTGHVDSDSHTGGKPAAGVPGGSTMNWFRRSGLSSADRETARRLIRHLQKMYAYQQLSMEGYNDALAFASGNAAPTHEGLVRPQLEVASPNAVREYVLPAILYKVNVFEQMEEQHQRFGEPNSPILRQVYADFSASLEIAQARAVLQYEGFDAWSQDTSFEGSPELAAYDAADEAALTKSTMSLNDLIAKVGMKREAWLELNCEVFNEVRGTIGMEPLGLEDFMGRYMGGLTGQPARFFRD